MTSQNYDSFFPQQSGDNLTYRRSRRELFTVVRRSRRELLTVGRQTNYRRYGPNSWKEKTLQSLFVQPIGVHSFKLFAKHFCMRTLILCHWVKSLSSSASWSAIGGKSGASFSRTADERFIIKCISRTELQSVLEYIRRIKKELQH